jgi:nicotinamidase-related amidase
MRIQKDHSALVVVDIQERLFPHIHNNTELTSKVRTLIQGFQALQVPLYVTEQYTKGLGHTIPEIQEVLDSYDPIEKMSFSCMGEAHFTMKVEEHYKENIILCGIETHVCVLQTALDLQDAGHRPIVIADAVSSRNPYDKEIALNRLQTEGIRVSTVESILFELCKTSGTDTFKQISRLVK